LDGFLKRIFVSLTGGKLCQVLTIFILQNPRVNKIKKRSGNKYLIVFYFGLQWPCGLRRGSAAARLLILQVRIPPGA
jgi:hypothetical protein